MVLTFYLCGLRQGILIAALCAVTSSTLFIPANHSSSRIYEGNIALATFLISTYMIGLIVNKLQTYAKQSHALFENSFTGMVAINPNNRRMMQANHVALAMWGYEKDEFLTKTLSDLTYFEDIEELNKSIEQLTNGLVENCRFEKRYIKKDRSFFWGETCLSLLKNTHGQPNLWVSNTIDITERKQVEESLKDQEERLALATVNNGVGIWDWNIKTQEMIWDDSMYALYHIRREDFSGTEEAWRASLHPDDLARGDQEVEDALSGKKPFETEFRVIWPNGEIRYIKAIAKVFRDDQGNPIRMLGINMDISDRKNAETELRKLNNDFVTLLENTGDFIFFKDQNSRILFCSQALAHITGHPNWRTMIGKLDHEIIPKDLAHIFYEEELSIFQDGKPILNKQAHYYDMQGKQRWVNTNKRPVFDDDKKTVIGIFGISHDITGIKEAEDKINEINHNLEQRVTERTAQLETANKELEAFSYSVSHDLRAPLRAIDGFSRILLDDYNDLLDDEGKRLFKVVRDNATKMGQLIDDILQFSRTSRLEMSFSEINMDKLAHSIIEEFEPPAAEHTLQLEIAPLPSVKGDRAMMRQVFVNLLSNAIKFTRTREPAKIKVGGIIQGNEVIYFVQDNGVGFDMQYADKLYGVFQRLHGVHEFEGTGIGLAIVKRIITRHDGRVWAESKVNEGATFYFALPIKE